MQISREERMAVAAARRLTVYTTCFVGIGVPSIAAMLCKRIYEPNLNLIYESGVIGANPALPPLSTGSPSVARGADMVGKMVDVFGALQAGRIEVGILSGAQVDIHGNLNSTVIGSFDNPVLRLPGSGGALDIALLVRNLMILMPHEPRRLVGKVDFITSPGRSDAPRSRSGPRTDTLVTDKATFRFVRDGVELVAHYEDVDPEKLGVFHNVRTPVAGPEIIPLPTARELETLKTFLGGDNE